MTTGYPRTYAEVGRWARQNNTSVGEAKQRFAQFAVLLALSRVAILRRDLVFKGGNALDFAWQPNRSTQDLDFSVDSATATEIIDEEYLTLHVRAGIRALPGTLGIAMSLQRVRRNPPGRQATFAAF